MKLTDTVISREQNKTSAGAPSAIQTAQRQDVRDQAKVSTFTIVELNDEEMKAVAGGVGRGFGYVEM